MSELAAADKTISTEECLEQKYYAALTRALKVSDIRLAYSLLQLYLKKSSNMSYSWWEMHQSACKVFITYGHGKIFKMFIEYIQYKPVYENSTASPLDTAVNACDLKLLDTFVDCVDLDEKIKTRMACNAYTNFFQHENEGPPERRMETDCICSKEPQWLGTPKKKKKKKKKNEFTQIITNCNIAMVRRLLELGADVNGGPSVFPLCEAARVGSYALVELLCQHGADVNKIDVMFRYPSLNMAEADNDHLVEMMVKFAVDSPDKNLHYSAADVAFVHGHTECARRLVQHGANIDIASAVPCIIHLESVKHLNFLFKYFRYETQQYILENKNDLLMLAVSEANIEIVSHIFGIVEYPYWEALLTLSKNGEIAKFCIQKGADVNKMIKCGSCTPLYMVLTRNMSLNSRLQVVQVLLENGASPNIHGDISPLMLAALTVDSTDLLQLLLDYGADINWRDEDGNTALLYSTYQLCKCNASCHNSCNIKCFTVTGCVSKKHWHRNSEFLMNYAKDKDLLNAQNNDGLTPLMQAARYSNVAVVSEMINQGSDVNMTDNNGNTALLYAINRINQVGNYMADSIITCLVKAGSAVNWQNNDGISPLMLATNRCSYKVIELLFDADADVNAVSKSDRSKAALSYFQPASCFSDRRLEACLSQFLLRGACLSYLQAEIFHNILFCNDILTANKYFINGMGPISVRSNKYFDYFSHIGSRFYISPLCTALLSGNISLAHHFIEIMFLTKSDLSSLMYNKIVHADLEESGYRQCMDLLDEMSSQPVSLLRLAFVTVSSAVGTSPGRENRVNMLPIPQTFKDKLLFKSPLNLTIPATDSENFLPFDPLSTNCINLSYDCECCQAEKLKKQHGIHCL